MGTAGGAASNARSVRITRLEKGRYRAVNDRGGVLDFGTGEGTDFTPVELLLAAIGGCSSIDVDLITSKRAEPAEFEVAATAEKIKDEHGNRLTGVRLDFDVSFPDDDAGHRAEAVLHRSVQQSHDRLCTVTRTVELGTAVGIAVRGEDLSTGPSSQ